MQSREYDRVHKFEPRKIISSSLVTLFAVMAAKEVLTAGDYQWQMQVDQSAVAVTSKYNPSLANLLLAGDILHQFSRVAVERTVVCPDPQTAVTLVRDTKIILDNPIITEELTPLEDSLSRKVPNIPDTCPDENLFTEDRINLYQARKRINDLASYDLSYVRNLQEQKRAALTNVFGWTAGILGALALYFKKSETT